MPDESKTLQPVIVEDVPAAAPVNPPVRVTTNVDAIDRAAQIVDGRVHVSDDISDQAVEAGHAPDLQPRASSPAVGVTTGVGDSLGGQLGSQVYPDTTAGQVQALRDAGKDAEADEIVNKAAAAVAAFDEVTAPLSVKTEVRATQLVEEGFEAPDPQATPPTGGPVEQIPLEHTTGDVVQGSGALTSSSPDPENPGVPPQVEADTQPLDPTDIPTPPENQ